MLFSLSSTLILIYFLVFIIWFDNKLIIHFQVLNSFLFVFFIFIYFIVYKQYYLQVININFFSDIFQYLINNCIFEFYIILNKQVFIFSLAIIKYELKLLDILIFFIYNINIYLYIVSFLLSIKEMFNLLLDYCILIKRYLFY